MQETSIRAYYDLSKSRFYPLIIKELEKGSATNKEIARSLGLETSTMSARMNELVAKGVVKEQGQRVCKISGRRVIAWELTN